MSGCGCDGKNNGRAGQLHVAIIGSGSAAFACAIKATEGGARVTLIEGADVIVAAVSMSVVCLQKSLFVLHNLPSSNEITLLPDWKTIRPN